MMTFNFGVVIVFLHNNVSGIVDIFFDGIIQHSSTEFCEIVKTW